MPNSHSDYIPTSKTTGAGLGDDNPCRTERLQSSSSVIACDILGFLRFLCGTESSLLIASLIQTQKTNKFQMNAYCHIFKDRLHLLTQLFPLHFSDEAPYSILPLLFSSHSGKAARAPRRVSPFFLAPQQGALMEACFLEVVTGKMIQF